LCIKIIVDYKSVLSRSRARLDSGDGMRINLARLRIGKVVMPIIALLLLTMMIVTPAKAVTKVDYWATHEMDLVDPGKIWVTEGGIQHVKDSYWRGSSDGSLGNDGIFEVWYEHITLNLVTGEGTFNGKFIITIPDKGTIEGSGRGIITGFVNAPGTFVATHGTGDFLGSKSMGSYTAVFTTLTHYHMDCVGTTIYP
jgi:hypothetical protein